LPHCALEKQVLGGSRRGGGQKSRNEGGGGSCLNTLLTKKKKVEELAAQKERGRKRRHAGMAKKFAATLQDGRLLGSKGVESLCCGGEKRVIQ